MSTFSPPPLIRPDRNMAPPTRSVRHQPPCCSLIRRWPRRNRSRCPRRRPLRPLHPRRHRRGILCGAGGVTPPQRSRHLNGTRPCRPCRLRPRRRRRSGRPRRPPRPPDGASGRRGRGRCSAASRACGCGRRGRGKCAAASPDCGWGRRGRGRCDAAHPACGWGRRCRGRCAAANHGGPSVCYPHRDAAASSEGLDPERLHVILCQSCEGLPVDITVAQHGGDVWPQARSASRPSSDFAHSPALHGGAATPEPRRVARSAILLSPMWLRHGSGPTPLTSHQTSTHSKVAWLCLP
jgi:hypothetical protein